MLIPLIRPLLRGLIRGLIASAGQNKKPPDPTLNLGSDQGALVLDIEVDNKGRTMPYCEETIVEYTG